MSQVDLPTGPEGKNDSRVFVAREVPSWRQPGGERPFSSPPRLREAISVVGLAALADATLYCAEGITGPAAFLAASPVLFLAGVQRPSRRLPLAITGVMLCLLAARMAWLGNEFQLFFGLALLLGYGMALAGYVPRAGQAIVFGLCLIPTGIAVLAKYLTTLLGPFRRIRGPAVFSVVLPLVFVGLFSTFFVMANPDIRDWIARSVDDLFNRFWEIVGPWAPSSERIMFWCFAVWFAGAMLRPVLFAVWKDERAVAAMPPPMPAAPVEAWYYRAHRNTLAAVVSLFAAYLVFEFYTLWRRDFPPGFYYGGYAHEGAAWLTVALAAATLTLSVLFRGQVLQDSRIGGLKRWAWIWSFENFVLSGAVFGRLGVYVQFNGLTVMRMVGYFGVAAVVIGFALVVWKVRWDRSMDWLVERQIWTLIGVVFLFLVSPIHAIVTNYNVRQVLSGNVAPSVQIAMHPIDWEGVVCLPAIKNCSDPIIREGVLALLADQQERLNASLNRAERQGWTAWQGAERRAARVLARSADAWREYRDDPESRQRVFQRFREYAYQWW